MIMQNVVGGAFCLGKNIAKTRANSYGVQPGAYWMGKLEKYIVYAMYLYPRDIFLKILLRKYWGLNDFH